MQKTQRSFPVGVALYAGKGDSVMPFGTISKPELLAVFMSSAVPVMLPNLDGAAGKRLADRLAKKIKRAVAMMAEGEIVDIKVVVMTDSGPAVTGFHRHPLAADQLTESILAFAINGNGRIEERRFKPSAQGMASMASAFGR